MRTESITRATPAAGAASARRGFFVRVLAALSLPLVAAGLLAVAPGARAEAATPEALVQRIATDVIAAAKADPAVQAGDVSKIIALVDQKVMPSVDFEAVTRSAVGVPWRSATPEQRTRLQAEFKQLLVRVYAGALTQLKDQNITVTGTQPVQGSTQVVVRSEVRGKGEPIKLDYRLDKAGDAWKIIDVNVGGIWLVRNYHSQFAPVLNQGGLDGLIARLAEQNKQAAAKS
jgi:phospholipid transport system substrate-binding protein